MITAIRPKIAPAGVQSFNRAGVTNNPPIRVERQHSVGADVQKEQPFVPVDGESAWIGEAALIAESTERLAIEVEGQKRAVCVAICNARACDEEKNLN